MTKAMILLMATLPLMAGCGETPIRKSNCWSSMALLPSEDCDFRDVPHAK
ncbi:hypothetical protein [uncultured Paracoccus sp.]|nr:hypothetical protein [uncultured Paracoccus sp.]